MYLHVVLLLFASWLNVPLQRETAASLSRSLTNLQAIMNINQIETEVLPCLRPRPDSKLRLFPRDPKLHILPENSLLRLGFYKAQHLWFLYFCYLLVKLQATRWRYRRYIKKELLEYLKYKYVLYTPKNKGSSSVQEYFLWVFELAICLFRYFNSSWLVFLGSSDECACFWVLLEK